MNHICQNCVEKLLETGIASELYFMICKYYIKFNMTTTLYEPAFVEALRYLEINGFILTTEAQGNLIFAKPLTIASEEENEQKGCSGFCQRDFLDINYI